jgi:hypothetical protein
VALCLEVLVANPVGPPCGTDRLADAGAVILFDIGAVRPPGWYGQGPHALHVQEQSGMLCVVVMASSAWLDPAGAAMSREPPLTNHER